jgi:hypothetical protein
LIKLKAQAVRVTRLEFELGNQRRQLAESIASATCIPGSGGLDDLFAGLFVTNAASITDALLRGDIFAAVGNVSAALSSVEMRWLTVPVLVPGLSALEISLPLPFPEPAALLASRLAGKVRTLLLFFI